MPKSRKDFAKNVAAMVEHAAKTDGGAAISSYGKTNYGGKLAEATTLSDLGTGASTTVTQETHSGKVHITTSETCDDGAVVEVTRENVGRDSALSAVTRFLGFGPK